MRRFTFAALPLILIACSAENATGQNAAASANKPFSVSTVADFDAPWAMTFLPDGRALVTEKQGEMILFDPKNGTKIPVTGIPPVDSAGQGGLMDVAPSPTFTRDKSVYFSFSEARGGVKGVALARGTFNQAKDGTTKLDKVQIIFRASPYVEGNGHYSGRIAFPPMADICSSPVASGRSSIPRKTRKPPWARCCASTSTERQPQAIRSRQRVSILRSGPTAIATCWA